MFVHCWRLNLTLHFIPRHSPSNPSEVFLTIINNELQQWTGLSQEMRINWLSYLCIKWPLWDFDGDTKKFLPANERRYIYLWRLIWSTFTNICIFTSPSTAFYKACTTSLYYYDKPTPNAMFIVHNNSNLTRIEGVHAVCTCGGDLKIWCGS